MLKNRSRSHLIHCSIFSSSLIILLSMSKCDPCECKFNATPGFVHEQTIETRTHPRYNIKASFVDKKSGAVDISIETKLGEFEEVTTKILLKTDCVFQKAQNQQAEQFYCEKFRNRCKNKLSTDSILTEYEAKLAAFAKACESEKPKKTFVPPHKGSTREPPVPEMTYKGTVIDDADKPVSGVTIKCDQKMVATTDENGNFQFKVHMSDTFYNVYAQKIGYTTAFRIVNNQESNYLLKLKKN